MDVLAVGAGIGGLAAALSLHAAGIGVRVVDAARELSALGVGINILPHATRELVALGLADELAATGIPTEELIYHDRFGSRIWVEPRGLAAGYRWPQYSIQRGALQLLLLLRAVRDRLGVDAVRAGLVLERFELQPAETKRQVYIAQAWTSAHEVKPGDSITLTTVLAGENGAQFTRTTPLNIPLGSAVGPLNITVSDANTLNFPEFAGMNSSAAQEASNLIQLLNQYRGSEAAYLRVWRSQPAFTLGGPSPGAELPDPPPSVMLILADPSTSPTSNLAQLATRGSELAEIRIPVDGYVVSGAKTVQVEVKE